LNKKIDFISAKTYVQHDHDAIYGNFPIFLILELELYQNSCFEIK